MARAAGNKERPLWTCPECGHRFVARNMWHSCGRYLVGDHFRDKDPLVRELFDRFRKLTERCGPVTVYAQKTRIVFQLRVRFASVMPRKHWLDCGLWLKRRAEHPCLRRIESVTPRDHVHHIRLTAPADLDRAFADLLREACRTGSR